MGQYTYIFSTGTTTDTMQMSGRILNAEDLEPVKGILVGLHFDASDSAFTGKPFDRVARTDASGYFSIKGVNAQRNYRIYALQDADGDFRYSQPTEAIGWLNSPLTASSSPAVRYDTAWVDSTRYDSIRTIHYTRFMPDDIVVRAFKVDYRPRHFLKYLRDVPEWFTLYFTGPSPRRPKLRGLNFNADRSLFTVANRGNDTLTYWLTDTTLLHLDTLRLACTYDDWDDSLKVRAPKPTPSNSCPRRLSPNASRRNRKNWPSGRNSANAATNVGTSATKSPKKNFSSQDFAEQSAHSRPQRDAYFPTTAGATARRRDSSSTAGRYAVARRTFCPRQRAGQSAGRRVARRVATFATLQVCNRLGGRAFHLRHDEQAHGT